MKKKVIGVLVVLVLIGLWACSGSDTKSGAASSEAVSSKTEGAATESAAPETAAAETDNETAAGTETATVDTPASETAAETEIEMTVSQRNAVGAATNYLEYTAFSRAGLFDQLTSEYGSKFPEDDAEFAITYLEENALVDWDEQAIRQAQSYLDYSAFSRAGLIDQLASEYGSQYTEDQAVQAVDYLEEKKMVDWNEQAVRAAQSYLEYSTFSKDGLIDQLSSEYGSQFTREQAEYAAEQAGY